MKINAAKSSSYAGVRPESVADYIRGYAAGIAIYAARDELAGANKAQLNAIAAELETAYKRLAYILDGKY